MSTITILYKVNLVLHSVLCFNCTIVELYDILASVIQSLSLLPFHTVTRPNNVSFEAPLYLYFSKKQYILETQYLNLVSVPLRLASCKYCQTY